MGQSHSRTQPDMKLTLGCLFLTLAYASARNFDIPLPPMGNGIGGRIVGGQDADEGEYQWQVSWRRCEGDGGCHSCGGSILSQDWVLSAGHCCYGLDGGQIAAGINDRFDDANAHLTGFTKFLHPDYNPGNTNNDVCLLKVSNAFNFTNKRLAPIELNRNEDWAGSSFTVTGWGTLTSGSSSLPTMLQEVQVPYVGALTCKVEYFPYSITDGMICAGERGKDSCQGDSGGPMVHFDDSGKASLVGVVSWGIGCGGWLKPGVYARVSHYADWIEETMMKYSSPKPKPRPLLRNLWQAR